MAQSKLVEAIAQQSDISKADIKRVIDAFIYVLPEVVDQCENKTLTIRNFGTFRVIQTNPKVARNFKLGIAMKIPARLVLRFKASKALQRYFDE